MDDISKAISKLATEKDFIKRANMLDSIAIKAKNTLDQHPENIIVKLVKVTLPNNQESKITKFSKDAMDAIPEGKTKATIDYLRSLIKLEAYTNNKETENIVNILNIKGYDDVIRNLQSSISGYKQKIGNMYGEKITPNEANGFITKIRHWGPKEFKTET